MQHARRRGYDLSALRARQVADADFERFDLILAMDRDNLADLRDRCPPQHWRKLHLLCEFATRNKSRVVPDPYSGGADGFERVLDLIEDACDGLVRHLRLAAEQQRGGTS
jgi:protein-tyrosine phosphatase